MTVRLMRWKSGAAGDMLLKMLLDSDDIHSQNIYDERLSSTGGAVIDAEFVKSFPYDQISAMSLVGAELVDRERLSQQLRLLIKDYPQKKWLLKTHLYIDFEYPVIDIVVDPWLVPFAVKSSLTKKRRSDNLAQNYHPLIAKIRDQEILHKFDCYNFSWDIIHTEICNHQQILLSKILAGWDNLVECLEGFDFQLLESCRGYYERWLEHNQYYMPSLLFQKMFYARDFDYTNTDLSIEERYCFLVMSGSSFRNLRD